jgi:mannose-6-phosphate isomerase-like protein (cupin superfamily)
MATLNRQVPSTTFSAIRRALLSERFEVIEGAMRVIVGDEDRVYRPGETFEVPAGTSHQMGTGEPTTMRWKGPARTPHRGVLRAPVLA